MKKLRAALVAVAMLFGLTAVPAVSSAAPPRPATLSNTGQTECGQSSSLGTRVCFDRGTGYGPVVLIYTSGTTVYASFGVSGTAPSVPTFIASDSEWVLVNLLVTSVNGGAWTFSTIDSSVQNCAGQANCISAAPSNHDLLEWFASSAGYDFVLVD